MNIRISITLFICSSQFCIYGQANPCENHLPVCQKTGFIKTSDDLLSNNIQEAKLSIDDSLIQSGIPLFDLFNGNKKPIRINPNRYRDYWGIQHKGNTYRFNQIEKQSVAIPLSIYGGICLYGPFVCKDSMIYNNVQLARDYTISYGTSHQTFQISKGLNEKPVTLNFNSLSTMVSDNEDLQSIVIGYKSQYDNLGGFELADADRDAIYSFYIQIIQDYNKKKLEN